MRWSISNIIWVLWTMPIVDWFSRQIDSLRKVHCSLQETVTCAVAKWLLKWHEKKASAPYSTTNVPETFQVHFSSYERPRHGTLETQLSLAPLWFWYTDTSHDWQHFHWKLKGPARLLYSQFDHSPFCLILAYMLRFKFSWIQEDFFFDMHSYRLT